MSFKHSWQLGSRRAFIRRSAFSALALPFLRQRASGAETAPPRLIICTAMNGLIDSVREDQFQSKGDDKSLILSPQLASLEPIKNRVITFSGLDNMTFAKLNFASQGHDPAIGSLLTSRAIAVTPGLDGDWSVDQYLASQLGASAPFRNISLCLGDSLKSGFHTKGGGWLASVRSPQSLLDSLFSRLPTGEPTPGIDPQILRRRNVLDFVMAQNKALKAQLCGQERVILDSHLSTVERARMAVNDMPKPPSPTACKRPPLNLNFEVAAPANLPQLRDAQIEIVAMAAACQLSPVISYCLRPDGTSERYPFLPGVDGGAIFHDYAHGTSAAKATINGFIVNSFCKLVSRLQEIPDGNGTLLDNCIVMLVSDQRNGGEFAHDTANLPVVLAGGASGKLKGGRHLAYAGESFHKLLTSLCQLMGVNVNSFGQAEYSGGGLPRLLA
jgi:Protein of unknown function (DUF1552)